MTRTAAAVDEYFTRLDRVWFGYKPLNPQNARGEPMAPQNLVSVEVFYESVIVKGELDAWSSPVMIEKVLELAGPGRSAVDLDLSEVTFMDSSGLHALLKLNSLLPTMRIVAVSPQVQRVLSITDLTELVSTHGWQEADQEPWIQDHDD